MKRKISFDSTRFAASSFALLIASLVGSSGCQIITAIDRSTLDSGGAGGSAGNAQGGMAGMGGEGGM
ncbi:MAG TPA: hypothetical protein PKA58_28680, partial [Polyangium sp.]|nr:hypothetical protein [Polyangium sp.]